MYTVGLMLDRVDVFAVKGGFGGGIVAEDASSTAARTQYET